MSERDVRRTEDEPHDRLTRISSRAIEAIEHDPETKPGDKCIVFLDTAERGGIGLSGYDSDSEAMAALLVHLRAIFEANGKTLLLAPLGRG